MKIVFFVRRFYPLIGGVEKHCLEVGRRLVERGDEVTIVTERDCLAPAGSRLLAVTSSSESEARNDTYNGIRIYRIPITAGEKLKKFQIWKWLWTNRNLINEADIVQCHDVFYWFLPFKILYPKKKVFTTFHGYESSQPPSWNKILSHKMAGWLNNGCMAIGDFHQKWYGVKADIVSYGAVNSVQSSKPCLPAGRFKVQNCSSKLKVVFVGRLAKDTGILTYLQALKVLKDEGKNFSLIVCGGGPSFAKATAGKQGKEELEGKEYCRKHNLNVKFLGFVKNPQDYVNKSNFVFSSQYLGILEALMAKKLVFAVYNGQLKEDYLKMTPFARWIVIEKDVLALAKKLSYFAIRPEKSKEMIEEGFNWARQQTWEKLVNQYLSLWEKRKFHLLRQF